MHGTVVTADRRQSAQAAGMASAVMSTVARQRTGSVRRRVIPGFGLALGTTVLYLAAIVLLPLCALLLKASGIGLSQLVDILSSPRTLSAIRVTLTMAFVATLFNAVYGLLLAWALARYDFPGKRIADAIVDLPFALPTAVAGIALTSIYAPQGWLGRYLHPLGIEVAFTRLGIVVALTFIGLPFVVRSIQPVIEELGTDVEEASSSLGASDWQTFSRVIFPTLLPALLTGFTLAFARGLGEYGSVIFISGNMPMRTEITPLLIVSKLEQYDYAGATAIAVVMLVAAFVLLLVINSLQAWARRRQGGI